MNPTVVTTFTGNGIIEFLKLLLRLRFFLQNRDSVKLQHFTYLWAHAQLESIKYWLHNWWTLRQRGVWWNARQAAMQVHWKRKVLQWFYAILKDRTAREFVHTQRKERNYRKHPSSLLFSACLCFQFFLLVRIFFILQLCSRLTK